MEFLDQNAILFDETEESSHEQMQCHARFQEPMSELSMHTTLIRILCNLFGTYFPILLGS